MNSETPQLNTPTEMHHLFLSCLVQQAETQADIKAVWLEGSFGRGNADRYADVDAHLLIAENRLDTFRDSAETWLSGVAPLVLFSFMFQRQMINALTQDGLRVDLWLHAGDSIAVSKGRVRTLLNRHGCLQIQPREKAAQQPADVAETLLRHIGEFWRCVAITPTVMGRNELVTGFMGINVLLMSLTEVLIIANRTPRDRGVKNLNQFLPADARREIEKALIVPALTPENLAKAVLRLAGIMQQQGPATAEAFGIAYPHDLEKAVIRYVSNELRLLGLESVLEKLHRRFD